MPPPTYTSSAAHTFRQTPTPSSTTTTATQTATTPVLRLRAVAPPREARRPRIQWAEDVVDNEGLGRKRSKGMYCSTSAFSRALPLFTLEFFWKDLAEADLICIIVCCIYHAPHAVGESSDESSSSSDSESSDSDSSSNDNDDGSARMSGLKSKSKQRRTGKHDHPHEEGHGGCDGHAKPKKKTKHKKSGNAYEKMPKAKAGSATMTVEAQ